MTEQMSIFDMLYPELINPIREVARIASPYWTTSRQKLIDMMGYRLAMNDMNGFTNDVHKEFCPYGLAGHYGGGDSPNSLRSYEMRTDKIEVWYFDEAGDLQKRWYTWADFANEIARIISRGEWSEQHE